MSDAPITADPELERRFAALVAELGELGGLLRGISPQAAIPATGLVPDVVDGQLVESAWGNAIRDRALGRHDSYAALKSQWPTPADGAHALTLDDGRIYTRRLGRWYTIAEGAGVTMGPTDANGFFNIVPTTAGINLDVITGGWALPGWAAGADQYAWGTSRYTAAAPGQISCVVYKLSGPTGGTVARAPSASPTTWSYRITGYRT